MNDSGKYSDNWTVRDEFAAKAMHAILTRSQQSNPLSSMAGLAFMYADTMLQERAKQK